MQKEAFAVHASGEALITNVCKCLTNNIPLKKHLEFFKHM